MDTISNERAATPLPAKFVDPDLTVSGARRASVPFSCLETLWFNTGTLCNLTCHNCYIESSPRNDRLVYLSRAEMRGFLGEASGSRPPPAEIGFTGGEPFMNPEILGMIEDALAAGFHVLVLTNAMKPMQRLKAPLLDLTRRYGERLTLRVSLDHYRPARHEELRGAGSWQPTIDGLTWLSANGFDVSVAGRTLWGEDDAKLRAGFRSLFAALGVAIDADDPARLVLFPEMEADADVPEISEHCWGILGKSPRSVMCATSRMVVKRKGALRPRVVSCTLLPYDEGFEMGATLAEAARPVKLNHRHCALLRPRRRLLQPSQPFIVTIIDREAAPDARFRGLTAVPCQCLPQPPSSTNPAERSAGFVSGLKGAVAARSSLFRNTYAFEFRLRFAGGGR